MPKPNLGFILLFGEKISCRRFTAIGCKALPAVEAADKDFFTCCGKSQNQTLQLLRKLAHQDI